MVRILKIAAWIVVAAAIYMTWAYYSWVEAIEDNAVLNPLESHSTQVSSARVERSLISDWIYAEGTARAVKKAYLTFEVQGRVAEISSLLDQGPLKEGMRVPARDSKGERQLIARLDDKDHTEELRIAGTNKLRAERDVDIAQAQLRQSESNRKLAELRLKRLEQLIAKNLTSRQQFDEAKAQLSLAGAEKSSARARLSSAKAAVQAAADAEAQAARNVERTRIYAPWSGVIARLNIREGEYVSAQTLDSSSDDAMTRTFPVILIDDSAFEVAVEIPMYKEAQLEPGNVALLQRQDASPEKPMAADRQWLSAQVYSVAPVLTPESRTLRVKVRSTESGARLFDGELLKVKIRRTQKNTLSIPVQALIYRDNNAQVFVVDPDDQQAQLRQVTLGIREDDRIEVIAGLEEGDRVVTDGRQRLMDGDQVKLLEVAGHE